MSLSAFLAENALSVENVKFVASKRFLSDELDDKGKRKPMAVSYTHLDVYKRQRYVSPLMER